MRAPVLVFLIAVVTLASAQGPWSKVIPQINWADVHWGCTFSCAKWYAAGRLIAKPKNCDCDYIAVRSMTDNIWDDIGKAAKREAQKELKRGESALKKEGERLLKEEAKNLKKELGLDALSDYDEMIDKLSKRSSVHSDNIWDNLAKRAKQEAEKELKRGESALMKEGERLLKEEAKNLKKELGLDAMSDGVWEDFQKTLEKNGITMENFKEQMYTKIKAEVGKEIDIAEDAVIEYAKNYLKEKFSEAATNVKNKITATKAPAAAPAAKTLSDSKLTEEQEAELRRIIDEQTAVLKKGSLLGLNPPKKTLSDQTNEESDNIWDDLAKVAKKEAQKELKRGESALKKEGERLLKEEVKNLKKEIGLDTLGDTENIWDVAKRELKKNGIDVNNVAKHVKDVSKEAGVETAIASQLLIEETVRLIKEDLQAGRVDNAESRLLEAKEGAKDIGEAVKLKVLEELEKARLGLKKRGIDVADIVEKLLNKYSAMADQIDPNYSFTQELYKLIPELDWKKVNGPCTIDCAVYWLAFKHWGPVSGCECEKLAVKNISDPNYVPYVPPPAQQEQQPQQPPAGVPMAPKRNSLVERSYEHKELADVSQRLRDVIRGVDLDRLNVRCTVACARWNFSLRKGPKPRVPGCDCDSPLRG
jgi:hypothetical protein